MEAPPAYDAQPGAPAVVVVQQPTMHMGVGYPFREDDIRWYFCGNTHVRKGVEFLGWLKLVLSIVSMVILVFYLSMLFVMVGRVHDNDYTFEHSSYGQYSYASQTAKPGDDDSVKTARIIIAVEAVVLLVVFLIFSVLPAWMLIKASRNYGPTWYLYPSLILAACGSVSLICLNPFALIALAECWVIYRYNEYLNQRDQHNKLQPSQQYVPTVATAYTTADYTSSNAPAAYTMAVGQTQQPAA